MLRTPGAVAAILLAAGTARAQGTTDPGPLAALRDDKQLAEALASITQDPAITVDDPATRALAQALMTEAVKQLQASSFDQALANFLEAYARFPSPKILLNIASTLHDMGRNADAANTYQRYLLDPATGAERVAEVKAILTALDEQLTILTVRVFPRGSEISIDGGPFISVGSSLLTRVRPGLHLVRIHKNGSANESTVNGFEGENKEVTATLQAEVTPDITSTPEIPVAASLMPDHVDGWLITGTQYSADSGTGRERKVRTGFAGPEIAALVPSFEATDDGELIVHSETSPSISSGVIAVLRIDGEGRGFAGGLGLALSRARLDAEIMVLKSDSTGGYLGLRYRLLTGWLRPYVGLGIPGFAYDQPDPNTMETSKKLAVGVRGAGGVELRINSHFSLQADLGYEHFFVGESTRIDANIFVPTVGVIGRL
jgi:hypothetical protein